jgi:hypothetical protein
MPTTPKLAIPYADPSEDMRDYPVGVDLPQASRIEAIFYPTVWTTVPATTAGTIKYALMGGLVIVQVDLSGGSWAAGTIYTVSGSPLPAAARPLTTIRGYADMGGYQGGGYLDTNGNVGIRHQSGGSRTNLNMTLVGFVK